MDSLHVSAMRLFKLLLAIGLPLTGSLFTSLPAKASIQFPESCRMGTCYKSTLESKEALRSNTFGTLYLVNETLNIYPQTFDDELAAQDYQRFVNFYGRDQVTEQRQEYVFCSPEIPSVLFESEGRYIMNRLALFQSPSSAVRSSHQTYLATCHNLAGPDYFSASVQNLLIREGYTTQYVGNGEQFSVPNILEIMELYPERY